MKTFFCLALLYVFSVAQKVEAHSAGNSTIRLVFREFEVKAEVSVPLSELEAAFGKDLQTSPSDKIREYKSDLGNYILSHISVNGKDGLPWQVRLQSDFSIENQPEEPQTLNFDISFRSPNLQSPRAFTISSDIIVHKILSHRILVIVKFDWGTGVSSDHMEGVGVFFSGQNELEINRGEGSDWAGIQSVFKLGMLRVKTEFYHLLFIFVLLLSMTVSYKNRALDFLKVLTAVGVGHFVTLLIVGVGTRMLPLRWDEILFALTIIVLIANSFLSLFPRKEWIVGLVFGLIYGFVSSTVIADFGLSAAKMLVGSISLSLGVLSMQLVIVILFAPLFYIAAKGKLYSVFKKSVLMVSLAICLIFFFTRLCNIDNILIPLVNTIVEYPEWIFLFTAVGCLLVRYQGTEEIK